MEASIRSVQGILGYKLVTSAVTSWEPAESGPVGNREIKSLVSIRDPGIPCVFLEGNIADPAGFCLQISSSSIGVMRPRARRFSEISQH